MNKKINILLAEDEPSLALIIKESLETRNFLVTHCTNGEKAFETYQKQNFDALVLDVMMPIKDGFTLAKEIRKTNKNIPIIFLTAKSQTIDVVEGFKIGGNDYLKKPFSMEELIVRIESLLNRANQNTEQEIYSLGQYQFDIKKQTLSINNQTDNLTYREVQVLEILLSQKNNLVERPIILNKIWGNDDFFNGRSLDVFITKLRKKLSQDPNIQILNSRSLGYKIIF